MSFLETMDFVLSNWWVFPLSVIFFTALNLASRQYYRNQRNADMKKAVEKAVINDRLYATRPPEWDAQDGTRGRHERTDEPNDESNGKRI